MEHFEMPDFVIPFMFYNTFGNDLIAEKLSWRNVAAANHFI